MNDRLLNHPMPPRRRTVDFAAVAGSAVPRAGTGPEEPLSKAREFAHDLEHLDEVGVEDRTELRDWKKRKSHTTRQVLYYGALALIPVVFLC